jgi:hypothetical protein
VFFVAVEVLHDFIMAHFVEKVKGVTRLARYGKPPYSPRI